MGVRDDDFNTGDNEGSAISTSTRSAAAAGRGARLPEARADAPNLTLDRRAGRAPRRRGGPRRRRPLPPGRRTPRGALRGEVVLSAGSVGSTQILERSGIGRRANCGRSASTTVPPIKPGVGEQSAGPSAAARHLQGRERRQDAERDLPQRCSGAADGLDYALPPARPADHGALAARHLHPLRSGAERAEHPVPHPAAVARQVRRSAAPLPGDHGQRLQSAADLARLDPLRSADPTAKPVIAPNYLATPRTGRSPPTPSASPAADESSRRSRLSPRGISARAGPSATTTRPGEGGRRHRHHDLPSRSARRRWASPAIRSAVVDERLRVHRPRRPARRRCLGDADDHLRQHQHADRDDRREGRDALARCGAAT
jgi:hypothetical protein